MSLIFTVFFVFYTPLTVCVVSWTQMSENKALNVMLPHKRSIDTIKMSRERLIVKMIWKEKYIGRMDEKKNLKNETPVPIDQLFCLGNQTV